MSKKSVCLLVMLVLSGAVSVKAALANTAGPVPPTPWMNTAGPVPPTPWANTAGPVPPTPWK